MLGRIAVLEIFLVLVKNKSKQDNHKIATHIFAYVSHRSVFFKQKKPPIFQLNALQYIGNFKKTIIWKIYIIFKDIQAVIKGFIKDI